MERYIIPRNKRYQLVVSKDIHDLVSLYTYQRQLTLVEATYHLLKLGFIHEYDLPVQDKEEE